MDNTTEEESVLQKKMAAALQRVEEHIAWKRAFFQARPPPPPIGQLHRRQQGQTKDHACHAAFQSAVAMHQHLKEKDEDTRNEAEALTSAPSTTPALTSSVGSGTPVVLSKQEAWAAQLHGEKERRNPSTDLNIRSDPTRTVIMANLHPDTVDEDLRHFADQFGRVLNVRIVRHHKSGRSRRYAFVEFGLAGEARRALQFHRKKRLKGYAVIIDREKGRTEAGFLPKRLATADAYGAPPPTARTDPMAAAANTADGRDGVGQVEATASSKGATSAIPEDDDDFLNSILNS